MRAGSLFDCLGKGLILICLSLALTGFIYQRAYHTVKLDIVSASKESSAETFGRQYFRFTNASAPLAILSSTFSGFLRGDEPSSEHQTVIEGRHKSASSLALAAMMTTANALSIDDVKVFLKNINEFLVWSATMDKHLYGFNRFSNTELHLMNILSRHVRKVLLAGDGSSKDIFLYKSVGEYAAKGYQCSAKDAEFQEYVHKKGIEMDICSEIEWYKLVQLTWPSASRFIDIGANKGYLGSLFAGLWGGGELKLSPVEIYETARRLKLWTKSRNPAGFCKDGFNYALPLFCPPGKRNQERGTCDIDRSADSGTTNQAKGSIRVYSIEGSKYLSGTLNRMIQSEFTHPEVRSGKVWKYFNFAVSDKPGIAAFSKQSQTENPGFEGGRIRPLAKVDTSLVEIVNKTTVDLFLADLPPHDSRRGIDILKIDAEGEDIKILAGASEAIRKSVGLFTFEAAASDVSTLTKEMVHQFDSLGFSCYSTTRAGLYKWNGGCMSEKMFDHSRRSGGKGNVFCVSRRRAPLTALSFDALCFPLLAYTSIKTGTTTGGGALSWEEYRRGQNYNFSVDPHLKPESLRKHVFLNVKRFCSPWPACIAAQ